MANAGGAVLLEATWLQLKAQKNMRTSRSVWKQLLVVSGLALGVTAVAGSNAEAQTATADLEVSATVIANCTISTAPVNFGNYDPVSANATVDADSVGSVTVTCPAGSGATVMLGQGASPAAGSTDAAPARRMTSGPDVLSYNLYSDVARTTVWGNTTATGQAHTGTGVAVAMTVYGRIPAGENVPTGAYSDTVVATIEF